MRALFLIALLAAAAPAAAQIYRWTDASGRVHFSNATPPPGVKAVVVDAGAKESALAPAEEAQGKDCYTLRCQGERMEERQRRREAAEAKEFAERAANAPRPPRGLEFRKYVSIQRGMTEGELLSIAGAPDFVSDQGVAYDAPAFVQTDRYVVSGARVGMTLKTWTYLPTSADPFTTTITLVGGRVSDLERVRKF